MRKAMFLALLVFCSISTGCFGGDSDDGFEWPGADSDVCKLDDGLECSVILQVEGTAHHSIINPINGELWIVFLEGMIKSWDGENLEDVADLSEFVSRCHIEQGLLGLSLDDQFEDSKLVLLSYVESGPCEGENQSDLVLSSAYLRDDGTIDIQSLTVLKRIEQPYRNHNAGFLLNAGNGSYLWGVGDGGGANDPDSNGQNNSSELGTILFFKIQGGSISPALEGEENQLILHHGLRNPWRFDLDPSGRLWIADVGQACWEEVNLVSLDERKNLGWSEREGFHQFHSNGFTNEDGTCNFDEDEAPKGEGMTDPILSYAHQGGNCSITGGHWIEDNDSPALEGYVYGDFCTGSLWVLKESEGIWSETYLGTTGEMIVGFGEYFDNDLIVFDWTGNIVKIAQKS